MINFDDFDIEEVKQERSVTILKNVSPDFYDFLVNNNALDWIHNLENETSFFRLDTHNDVSYFLKNRNKSGYISRAFTWENTTEGWNFWNNLNREWIKKCTT